MKVRELQKVQGVIDIQKYTDILFDKQVVLTVPSTAFLSNVQNTSRELDNTYIYIYIIDISYIYTSEK